MSSWRRRFHAFRPLVLSVLLGWCGADRPLLQRDGVEPMGLMTAAASLGILFLWLDGPYYTMGAVLFFLAGAYVLRGWAYSVEWSIEETIEALRRAQTGKRRVPAIIGPAAGRYRGRNIPAWVVTEDGLVWEFESVAPQRSVRKDADTLLFDGFLYRRMDVMPEGLEIRVLLDGQTRGTPVFRHKAADCGDRARRILDARGEAKRRNGGG